MKKKTKILCALIDRYEPDLLDISDLDPLDRNTNVDKALKIFEDRFEIPHLMDGEDIVESPSKKKKLIIKNLKNNLKLRI